MSLGSPGFEPGAVASYATPARRRRVKPGQSRNAGTRTPSAWSQTRRANPYATSRLVNTIVEKVGIEPTTTTLARRVRSLSCHPHDRRCPWPRTSDDVVKSEEFVKRH